MFHYKMARRYHIKIATHFTAAVWLRHMGLLSSIKLCDTTNVSDFQVLQFMSWTAVTLNEFHFASSTFQVSGKRIHDHDIEVPAALFWIVNMVAHVSDWVLR